MWQEMHELAQLSNMTNRDPRLIARWFDCKGFTGSLVVRDLPEVRIRFRNEPYFARGHEKVQYNERRYLACFDPRSRATSARDVVPSMDFEDSEAGFFCETPAGDSRITFRSQSCPN